MKKRGSVNNSVKIILTGGHAATSALAVIERIQERHSEWSIIWVGSKDAFAKEKATTLDFQLFPDMGVKCYSIQMGKLQRRISFDSFIELLKIPLGMLEGFRVLYKEKPKIILSFGGFISLPIVWSARLFNIRVLIHEQTAAIGLANKLSLPFSTEVLLSRKQSAKYFESRNTNLVGLPLHSALLRVNSPIKAKPQTIYITGGSRGSQTLNEAVKDILPRLLRKYQVIHQTGSLDEKKMKKFVRMLPENIRRNYKLYAHIPPTKVATIYSYSDIVIARSGAHTAAEVIALKKPAIFIPIPWVQMNEQMLNAQLAKKYVHS